MAWSLQSKKSDILKAMTGLDKENSRGLFIDTKRLEVAMREVGVGEIGEGDEEAQNSNYEIN